MLQHSIQKRKSWVSRVKYSPWTLLRRGLCVTERLGRGKRKARRGGWEGKRYLIAFLIFLCALFNGPFYSCELSTLAFELK